MFSTEVMRFAYGSTWVRRYQRVSPENPTSPIQCLASSRTGWTTRSSPSKIGAVPREFYIHKLSDEFGQYTLVLKCSACGHERTAEPQTLGKLCGWDSRLEDVAKRMRCSKCGKKQCTQRAVTPRKPRGYKSLPN